MGFDADYGKVTTEYGEIPPDEPVLILRARDTQTPALLGHYRDLCEAAGSPPSYLRVLRENRDQVIRWQACHPGELRVPGTEPGSLVPPEVSLPEDCSPARFVSPFQVGVTGTGRKFELTFPGSLLVTGSRGSGRTNLENVIIAQLARCTDTVIFRICFTGGRSTRPWMMPWIEGRTPRPVIDWLATTREEAGLMLDALIAGCAARARYGGDQEKITPSAGTPAVILVADSMSVARSGLIPKLAEFAEVSRSEGMSLLRTELSGDTSIPAEVRIGLRAASLAGAGLIFPGDRKAVRALARLRNPGDGVVQAGRHRSLTVRCCRIGPDQVRETALVTGQLRSAPEDRLAAAMGEAYEQRWTRPHGLDLVREWRETADLPGPPAWR
jgi:hypothetical protein